MQQKKFPPASSTGRPSGTDGSDFSYRMVVDSRYTLVARGKSRLCTLFLIQAFVLLEMVLCTYLSSSNDEKLNVIAISSPAIYFLSLAIGELGRRQSKVGLLKVHIAASSLALLLWILSIDKDTYSIFHDPSEWESKKLVILEIVALLLGTLVQIFVVSTAVSLIRNMNPSKKVS